MEFHATSEKELIEGIWKEIKGSFRASFVCALVGGLGVGKTTLVKGIARKLRIKEHVASPTFNLRKVYPIKKAIDGANQFQHIDLYRFDNPSKVDLAEVMDWLSEENTISFVEWAENIPEVEKAADIVIKLESLGETARQVHISHNS